MLGQIYRFKSSNRGFLNLLFFDNFYSW